MSEEESRPIGRPTKYDPKYCEEVIEFFNKEPFEYVEVDVEDEETGETRKSIALDKFNNPIRVPCPLPTKERFAFSIGVHRATLVDWMHRHPEFLDAIKKAEDLQKDILIQNGLIQSYDKTFAIFVAKNVTDMSDKKELDHTSSDGSMTPNPSTIELVAPNVESSD